MASKDSLLFTPLKLGKIELSHRVVLSALTRLRADKNHVATDLMKEYYLQRTSLPGGLIIAESTSVAKHHGGMSYTSAIWGEEHLMAFGRAAQPLAAEEDGFMIKGHSAIPFEGGATPEEMMAEDIKSTIEDYVRAAKNAMRAGFDGIELYAANGYLLDQFIQDVSNKRTDEYGGSIEDRNRLVVEIAQAVSDAVGAERVGIKLSPWSDFQGMRMENPVPQFTDLIKRVNDIGIGYLNLIESRVSGVDYTDGTETLDWAWAVWDKAVIATGGYLPETALELVERDSARDIVVAFGRRYVSNPDLPFRIQRGLELNPYDRSTFYKVGAPEGLIDYPFSKEYLALGN
ncbi:hypothetical protein MKX07_004389 [Trichoderma sp. CBMAI-0711]|nr:hypothetical protein MKX07_004389 [Trichoderma sp. CBMAI-0711]